MPHLRDDDCAFADLHVMADLHEIIDLRAFPDHGVSGPVPRSMVDAGADFDIILDHHAAELGHFHVALAAEGEAEAVLPDMHAAMDEHAVADETMADGGERARYAYPRRSARPHRLRCWRRWSCARR